MQPVLLNLYRFAAGCQTRSQAPVEKRKQATNDPRFLQNICVQLILIY